MKKKVLAILTAIGVVLLAVWYFFLTGDEKTGDKNIKKQKIKQKKREIDDLEKKSKALLDKAKKGKIDSADATKKIVDTQKKKENLKQEIHDLTDEELAKELGDLLGGL